jgi:hypothetical protein
MNPNVMLEVHGVCRVRRADVDRLTHDSVEDVIVSDGLDQTVRVGLRSSSYVAVLPPLVARFIAAQLIASADRADAILALPQPPESAP